MYSDYPATTRERLKLLDHLRVVLVEVKFSGNIGMTARALKNTAVSDLRLVAPRAELNKEAYQLAPSATDVLDRVQLHGSLGEAVADCGLVIGTTRRRGVMRRNIVSGEEAAEMVRSRLMVNKVALVFGSEDNGLDNDDLALCQWIVGLHTGSGSESFNLSHAVAILCYLINRSIIGPADHGRKLARARDLEPMYDDWTRFLLEIGFIIEADPRRMMMAIRQLFHRAALSDRDVKIVRGVLRQARWRIKNPTAPLVPRDTHQTIKRAILKQRKEEEDA